MRFGKVAKIELTTPFIYKNKNKQNKTNKQIKQTTKQTTKE